MGANRYPGSVGEAPLVSPPATLTMSRADYRDKNVRNVPETVKRALVNEASARGVTIQDVVGRVLAERYSEAYEDRGNPATRPSYIHGDQLVLKLPPSIIEAVWREAKERKITESGTVLLAVAEKFGLLYVPPRRGRKLGARG